MLDKKSKKVILDYTKVAFQQAVDCARQKYKMGNEWLPTLKVVFKHDCSKATKTGITLCIDFGEIFNGKYFNAPEYIHIKNDPDIGSFKTTDWRLVIKSLIAHELAHNVDIIKDPSVLTRRAMKKTNYDGHHGKTWQTRYKWLLKNAWKDGKRIPTNNFLT